VNRRAVVLCAAVALAVAVLSAWRSDFEIATASTTMVVDTPRASVVDPLTDTYGFASLSARAVLLGSVMADGPVRAAIARRAGVPAGDLRVEAPLTPIQPRPTVQRGQERRTGDLLRSGNQLRLHIDVDPVVPVLDVYAQAPTATRAERLADAAVEAARSELARRSAAERTPERYRLKLRQLGRAEGAVVNAGVRRQVGLVAFVLTFAAMVALLAALSRAVRRGRSG
jgi:hypothetical protein